MSWLLFQMSKIGTLLLAFLPHFAIAQIDGFEYEFEQPVQVENSVLVKWTLISGSTCNGTAIERSTDSIHYEVIGAIDGVCGSANFNIPYDFTDNSPVPNTINYYRLSFNRVGVSEALAVFVAILNDDRALVVPNPVRGEAVLYIENEKGKPLQFSLFDYNGKLVYSEGNLTDEKYLFRNPGLPQGVYFFRFTKEGEEKASGRMVVLD